MRKEIAFTHLWKKNQIEDLEIADKSTNEQ